MSESGGGLRIGDFFLRLWIWVFAPREKEPDLIEKWEAGLAPPRDDLTDPSIPKIKDSKPIERLGLREEAKVTWDDITRRLPPWEIEAAMPTALVTRREVPRADIASHNVRSGQTSYLGGRRNPAYRPRHSTGTDPGEGAEVRPGDARVARHDGAARAGGNPANNVVPRKGPAKKRRAVKGRR